MQSRLTDDQKADCQKILDRLVAYWWSEIEVKMIIKGLSYEEAVAELMREILNEAKP